MRIEKASWMRQQGRYLKQPLISLLLVGALFCWQFLACCPVSQASIEPGLSGSASTHACCQKKQVVSSCHCIKTDASVDLKALFTKGSPSFEWQTLFQKPVQRSALTVSLLGLSDSSIATRRMQDLERRLNHQGEAFLRGVRQN